MKLPGYLPMLLACGLYLWQAVEYTVRSEYPLAMTFCMYALANAGMIWDFARRLQ